MLKLLERNILSVEQRLVLLAPPSASVHEGFRNVEFSASAHQRLVTDIQRMRGRIYLEDGAVERRHLSTDGLHRTAEDENGWHLLMLDAHRRVTACVWYLEHEPGVTPEQLRVRRCPLASDVRWRRTLWDAVTSELDRARRDHLRYAEVGGWAVAKESRCTSEGLLLALAAYSLGRLSGGALGMTTATVRHSSSTILRRIGGSQLEVDGIAVPSYYDPHYKCEMELLRFDSRRPSAKYAPLIEMLKGKLANVLVITTPALATGPAGARPAAAVMAA